MKLLSVSPLRCEIITPHPSDCASFALHGRTSAGVSALLEKGIRRNRLGNRANLVHLEEQRVGRLFLNGNFDPLRARHCEVVRDDLRACASREVRPRCPVVLCERVLEQYQRILLQQVEVHVRQLRVRKEHFRVRLRTLEIEVVLAILEELGRRGVEPELDLTLVPRILDC